MKRPRSIVTALLPAMLLAGCAGTQNRGLESVHQPVVSKSSYALDVATAGNDLAPGEEQRLGGWMASLRLGYGDAVAIDDTSLGGTGAYGNGVRDAVSRETARYGLLVADDVPLSDSPVMAGMARIVVTRMKATVPGCPDFTRIRQPEFEGQTSSNQGCAINSNLASMVASPADLVRGQTGRSTTDPATSGRAIDIYRKAIPTGGGGTVLKAEGTGGGSSK